MAFVDAAEHRYLDDPIAREEGGTPALVESIRAGMVFALKEAVGTGLIEEREQGLWCRALDRWQTDPSIEILGHPDAQRLSIVSFRIRSGAGRYLHHNFVVAVLNDLFGIQALWHHRNGPARPPLRLTDVLYDDAGTLRCPPESGTLGVGCPADHPREAQALLDARPDEVADGITNLPAHFESLRWFPLPQQCLLADE